jgi:hypothetical protein
VLIDRKQPHSVRVMQQNSDRWSLLYRDEISELWGRSAKYDDAASPSYLATDQREIDADQALGWVSWPAFPSRVNSVSPSLTPAIAIDEPPTQPNDDERDVSTLDTDTKPVAQDVDGETL